jgi:hypothetical protein
MAMPGKDALVAIVAVSAAVASIYFSVVGRSPKVNLDTYQVLGTVTAEETAKLLADQGRILVLARGTGDEENPSVEAELSAFRDTLKKHRGLNVVIQKVEVTPMQMMATGGGIPNEALLKAIETNPGLAGLVLFFGVPPLEDSEIEALQKSGVKIVVVSSFQPGLDRLFERRAIHLAIVPRPDTAPAPAQPPRTVRERFDQEYAILTPPAETR